MSCSHFLGISPSSLPFQSLTPSPQFGVLFKDEKLEQQLESLVGTLKAAKKRKILDFEGQMLLQGAHDNVDVILKQLPQGTHGAN